MKLGKIFICINILVLSLLMLTGCTEKWPRIIYQNTSYRFDEYNRTIVLDDGYVLAMILQKRKMAMILFSILLQNDKSFAIGEKYIEIGRVTYATAI